MYASIGFTGDDRPVRVSVTPRKPTGALLHIDMDMDFSLVLDVATARNARDALDRALAAIDAGAEP